jgi:hypothetical protein
VLFVISEATIGLHRSRVHDTQLMTVWGYMHICSQLRNISCRVRKIPYMMAPIASWQLDTVSPTTTTKPKPKLDPRCIACQCGWKFYASLAACKKFSACASTTNKFAIYQKFLSRLTHSQYIMGSLTLPLLFLFWAEVLRAQPMSQKSSRCPESAAEVPKAQPRS